METEVQRTEGEDLRTWFGPRTLAPGHKVQGRGEGSEVRTDGAQGLQSLVVGLAVGRCGGALEHSERRTLSS